MINAGVGKTSDPKNLPQNILDTQFIVCFQIVIKIARLVHNHPSGDPEPSRADIEMTRKIVEAAKVFEIQVHDHLVVGRDGTASLRALGHFR